MPAPLPPASAGREPARPKTVNVRSFSDLSGPDLAGAITASTVVLQPIGSVEHHGSHLPLATDALVVDALARAVAGEAPDLDMLVLPTLYYGLSTEHVWAPGTVSLSPSTLLALLDDIGASVARSGAKRFVFLNGHGGNTHLLRVAARQNPRPLPPVHLPFSGLCPCRARSTATRPPGRGPRYPRVPGRDISGPPYPP